MGDISRQVECEAFLREFGDEVLRRLSVGKVPWVCEERLGIDEDAMNVRLFLVGDLGHGRGFVDLRVEAVDVLFDPGWDSVDRVERLSVLLGISEGEATRRLAVCGLFE
jgi:hypothetical protein